MRRRSGTYLIASALVIAAANPASVESRTAKVPRSCVPSGRHTLLIDAQANVYLRPQSTPVAGVSDPEELVACANGARRRYALGPPMAAVGVPQVDEGITSEALSGPILAYSKASAARAAGYAFAFVIVRDLRTGRVMRRTPAGSSLPPAKVGTDPAAAIVVRSDGAVAWITQVIEDVPLPETPCPGPNPCAALGLIQAVTHSTVHALDKSGNRLVASGTNIAPDLTLRGSTLHWTQGGTPMSARLD